MPCHVSPPKEELENLIISCGGGGLNSGCVAWHQRVDFSEHHAKGALFGLVEVEHLGEDLMNE